MNLLPEEVPDVVPDGTDPELPALEFRVKLCVLESEDPEGIHELRVRVLHCYLLLGEHVLEVRLERLEGRLVEAQVLELPVVRTVLRRELGRAPRERERGSGPHEIS